MPNNNRVQIVNSLSNHKNLPVFPLTAQKILAQLANPHMNLNELANVIKSDQVYAGSVLKLVNSANSGLPRSITNMAQAINLLGLVEIRKMVYALSARSLFDSNQSYVTWSHALASAFIGEMLAKENHLEPNDGYLAALFHDIGKLFLIKNFPAVTALVFEKAYKESAPLNSCETAILGIDHAEIGALIADSWRLGAHISRAVRSHHLPYTEIAADPFCCLVALANQIDNARDARSLPDQELMLKLNQDPRSVQVLRDFAAQKVLFFD